MFNNILENEHYIRFWAYIDQDIGHLFFIDLDKNCIATQQATEECLQQN